MTERGLKASIETLKNPTKTLESILVDPEFDAAVEIMLLEGKNEDYHEIVEAMANVIERHGITIDELNNAIRFRFEQAGHPQEPINT